MVATKCQNRNAKPQNGHSTPVNLASVYPKEVMLMSDSQCMPPNCNFLTTDLPHQGKLLKGCVLVPDVLNQNYSCFTRIPNFA